VRVCQEKFRFYPKFFTENLSLEDPQNLWIFTKDVHMEIAGKEDFTGNNRF